MSPGTHEDSAAGTRRDARRTNGFTALLFITVFVSACVTVTRGGAGTGAIGGVVTNLDGAPIAGASVHTPAGDSTTTAADGSFTLGGLRPTDRLAVTIVTRDYVRGSVVYPVHAGETFRRPIQLIPRSRPVRFDARTGGEVTLPRGGRIVIPANAFETEGQRAAQGPVTVRVTYIDPMDERHVAAAPGDYTAVERDGGVRHLETFGMIEMVAVDSQGQPLRLMRGQGVEIGWPSGREVRVSPSRSLYNFDEGVARWVSAGPNRTFGATLPYNPPGGTQGGGWGVERWNDDDTFPRACITVQVTRSQGSKIEGVTATGVNYSGTSYASTNSAGTARLNVRPLSDVRISVNNPSAQKDITSPAANSNCSTLVTLNH